MAADGNKARLSDFVPNVALGIAAHPDDLDATAAGSVAAWTAAGAEVYYLVLTDGSKGSADLTGDPCELVGIRRREQQEAARILGVKDVFFCDYKDGELQVSKDVRRDICRYIRKLRPDTVFTMDPTVIYVSSKGFINHPDHRAAGQATLDAVYPLARDHLAFPELYTDEKLEPHKVGTVLLSNFSADCDKHTCVFDITATIETKLQALAAHTSQFSDLDGTLQFFRQLAAEAGAGCGVGYAEGFVRLDVR